MTGSSDELLVRRLIARFANSFDLKDWDQLGRCLSDRLMTDYSDLRGTPPETVSRERFLESRRTALQELTTHHLCGNIEMRLKAESGEARVSMVIFRRRADGAVFNTHCLYTMAVVRAAEDWIISSIAQKVLWSDGQPAIHPGAKTSPESSVERDD